MLQTSARDGSAFSGGLRPRRVSPNCGVNNHIDVDIIWFSGDVVDWFVSCSCGVHGTWCGKLDLAIHTVCVTEYANTRVVWRPTGKRLCHQGRACKRLSRTRAGNRVQLLYHLHDGRWAICARVYSTAGCLSFGPMAQCVVHALKGLACRARVSLQLARLPRTASGVQR